MVGRGETHDLGQQHPGGDKEEDEDEEDEACSRMWNILLAAGGCWEVMLCDQKGTLFWLSARAASPTSCFQALPEQTCCPKPIRKEVHSLLEGSKRCSRLVRPQFVTLSKQAGCKRPRTGSGYQKWRLCGAGEADPEPGEEQGSQGDGSSPDPT